MGRLGRHTALAVLAALALAGAAFGASFGIARAFRGSSPRAAAAALPRPVPLAIARVPVPAFTPSGPLPDLRRAPQPEPEPQPQAAPAPAPAPVPAPAPPPAPAAPAPAPVEPQPAPQPKPAAVPKSKPKPKPKPVRAKAKAKAKPRPRPKPKPVAAAAPKPRVLPVSVPAPATPRSTACTLYAAPSGSDSAPGTAARPFRTVTRLVAGLGRGDTGCLAAGATFAENVTVLRGGAPGAPIVLQSAPGRRATIAGSLTIARPAHDVVVGLLTLRGAGRPAVTIAGSRVTLLRDDVSGNSGPGCVLVETGDGVTIDGNVIHGCAGGSYAAGVYVKHATRTRVTNNFVVGNGGDGVALVPATRALVEHNVVDGNWGGVYFGGDRVAASTGNLVLKNIVSNSTQRYNVHADYPRGAPSGRGNVVEGNCVWNGALGNLGALVGFSTAQNLAVDPGFRDRTHGYAFGARTRCSPLRPRSYAADPLSNLLPRGRIAPRLTGEIVGGRVRRLTLAPLPPGTRVRVSCVSGCSARSTLAVRHGSATAPDLAAAPAAVLAVTATQPGFVGYAARIAIRAGRPPVATTSCLPAWGAQRPVACSRLPGGR